MIVMWLVIAAVVVLGLVIAAKGVRRVPNGQVGIVYRRFGARRPGDDFKVKVNGSAGPQAATLEADSVCWLPPLLYTVKYVPQTYVPPGTIGVVVAKAGRVSPPTRTLCEPIECSCFQDGRAFLLGGGQMGRQPEILPGGASYDINPELFDVLTVYTIGEGRHDLTAADLKEISIPEGSTGVVIVLEGAAPDESDESVRPWVPGHDSFQNVAAFLANGGQRGAQTETLCGGVYRVNPWFARIVLIPTRVLILQWTKRESKAASRFDSSLDRIRINIEGHWLRFDLSQTIQISAKAAPALVGRFGEQDVDKFGFSEAADPTPVQRFVERVLGPTVEGYFVATANQYDILDFIAAHNAVSIELAGQIREALSEWGIDAVDTTMGEFEPENEALDQLRTRIAVERDRKRGLQYQYENAQIEEKIKQDRLKTDAKRRKLEVVRLAEEVKLLGRESVALRFFLAELKDMKVPEIVGGNADQILQHLPFVTAQEMIHRAMRRAEKEADSHLPQLEFVQSIPRQRKPPLSARPKRDGLDIVHDWTEGGTE